MKKLLVAVLMSFPMVAVAMAQTESDVVVVPSPAPIVTLNLDLYNVGHALGQGGQWQFGIDKSPTAGACVMYDVPDKKLLAGPCRDVLILAHNGQRALHAGGAVLYELNDLAQKHPFYMARAGVNVGPAAHAALVHLSEKIPYLESLADYKAPVWAQYLGSIATVDAAGGYNPNPYSNEVRWPWGAQLKLDFPLADIASLFTSAGVK